MTPNEFLKTEANPDDVIAITCDKDWDLKHLENLMQAYHERKLKLLGIADVVGQSEQFFAFTDWYFKKDKEIAEALRPEFEYWLKNKNK